jgi:hypothetical protein
LSNVGIHAVVAPVEEKLGTLGKGLLSKFDIMSKVFEGTKSVEFAE